MDRRSFFAALAAGAVVTAEGLWFPGQKLISIPKTKFITVKNFYDLPAHINYFGGSFILRPGESKIIPDRPVFTNMPLQMVINNPSQHKRPDPQILQSQYRIVRLRSLDLTEPQNIGLS